MISRLTMFTFTFTGLLFFNEEKLMVNDNLEELEKAFAPAFLRANRQYLVNRKAIKAASNFFNRKIIVNLTVPFKAQIIVGKIKPTGFVEWLAAGVEI